MSNRGQGSLALLKRSKIDTGQENAELESYGEKGSQLTIEGRQPMTITLTSDIEQAVAEQARRRRPVERTVAPPRENGIPTSAGG